MLAQLNSNIQLNFPRLSKSLQPLQKTTYHTYLEFVFLSHVFNLLANANMVSQKKGISECYSFCFTAHLIWSLEYSFLIQLKIEIHMLVASTKPFMSDIRELRNISFFTGIVCSYHLTVQLLIVQLN